MTELPTQSNVFWLFYAGLLLLTAAGVWATFRKAGQHGWTCIIPFYNLVVLLRVVRMHRLWAVAFFLPVVNIVFSCLVALRVPRVFGKGVGFGLGLVFLPFLYYPILGFGSANYQAPEVGTEDALPPRAKSQLAYRKAG